MLRGCGALLQGPNPLFSSLRDLRWREINPCESDLRLLIGPNLQKLTIIAENASCNFLVTAGDFSSWYYSTLRFVSTHCPRLSTIDISANGEAIPVDLTALAGAASVVRLSITGINLRIPGTPAF